MKTILNLLICGFVAVLILSAIGGAIPANAQADRCRETVDLAFARIGQNCAELKANSLCYGHPLVQASFADDAQLEGISHPSQRAPIASLSGVQTSALDLEQQRFGVAVINLGAMLPQTYQGPGILLLLAGPAEVTNEIDPATVAQFSEPLRTATLIETTIFKDPGILPRPIGTAAEDEVLLVDAFDHSREWLRVVNDGNIAWVARADVARLSAMDSLPLVGIDAAFPFQALSLSTDAELPACDQSEPMVAIQTPQDRPVNLTINGVDIHVGAMVTFQQVHRNALSMTVHRGKVTTVFGQTVQQGESVIGILGPAADGNARVLEWSGALPASEAEAARGQRAQDALNDLARANGWAEQQTFKFPPVLLHVVQSGESLYSIARLYETSVAEIITANLGDEPIKLYSGTQLIIPNPGSGFAGHGAVPLDATRGE